MATLQEVIEKIRQEAIQAGSEPLSSPLLDSTTLIELVLPRVIDIVAANVVKNAAQLHLLRTTSTVAVAAGSGSFPAKFKPEYVGSIHILEDETASYEPQWWSYINNGHPLFGSFYVSGSLIYYRAGGQAVGVFTGNLNLSGITTPSLPTTAGGTVNIDPYILEQIITTTVALVRGEIPLATVGLDYMAA